jgi:hypothetical protein
MTQLGQRRLKYSRPGLYWHSLHEPDEGTVKREGGDGEAG